MAPKKGGADSSAAAAAGSNAGAGTAEDPLPALFDEILRFAQQDDNDRVNKAADKVLKIAPGDHDALAAKLVALVRLDKFADAVTLLDSSFPSDLRAQFAFEEAYCLYRTNKNDQALKVLDKATASSSEGADPKLDQLRAQIAYKMEDYGTALSVTKKLVEDVSANELASSEYLTNFLAALAALVLATGAAPADALAGMELPSQDSRQLSYETAYNLGCYYASLNDLDRAVGWLELARGIGRKALQDDTSGDDQLQQDLATIAVELAYVYQKQGRNADAAELCHDILRTKITDPLLTAVASTNILAARGPHQELLDSAKRVKSSLMPQALNKLTAYQKRPVDLNTGLVSLWMNKPAECKAKLEELAEKYPDDELVAAVQAGIAVLDRKPQKTAEVLREALAKRPDSIRLALSLSQVLAEQGDAEAGLDTLLPVLQQQLASKAGPQPGLANLVVSLLEKKGEPERALELLESALKSWKTSKPQLLTKGPFLRNLADLKFKGGKLEEAGKDLELVHKENPDDVQAIAGLVAIYSKVDPAKAAKFEALLPPTRAETDASRVDVDELENLARRQGKSSRPGQKDNASPVVGTGAAAKPGKKRKRKLILPKNHDPNVQPDPERWLPKQQRSTFARKGKKKMQMLKGPQGGSSSYVGAGSGMTGSARIAGFEQKKPDGTTQEAATASGSPSAAESESKSAEAAAAKKAPPPPKKKKGKGKW